MLNDWRADHSFRHPPWSCRPHRQSNDRGLHLTNQTAWEMDASSLGAVQPLKFQHVHVKQALSHTFVHVLPNIATRDVVTAAVDAGCHVGQLCMAQVIMSTNGAGDSGNARGIFRRPSLYTVAKPRPSMCDAFCMHFASFVPSPLSASSISYVRKCNHRYGRRASDHYVSSIWGVVSCTRGVPTGHAQYP